MAGPGRPVRAIPTSRSTATVGTTSVTTTSRSATTPEPALLRGKATIRARATQNLSRFDLDLVGLDVHRVRVDGARGLVVARPGRSSGSTRGTPLRKHEGFVVRVRYSGVPELLTDHSGSAASSRPTTASTSPDSRTWRDQLVPGQRPPDRQGVVHLPRDRAAGREVVANGHLVSKRPRGGWTTWTYDAPSPMASYLATVDVGELDFDGYRKAGLRYLDAVDPDLYDPVAARPRAAGSPCPRRRTCPTSG